MKRLILNLSQFGPKKEIKIIFIAFCLIGFYFTFFPSIQKISIYQWLIQFFSTPTNNIISDIFFSLILLLGLILLLIKSLQLQQYSLTISDAILPLFVLAFYLFHRFRLIPAQYWHYTYFGYFPFLVYADAVCLVLLVLMFNPRTKFNKTLRSTNPLIEDNLYKTFSKDVLVRKHYAEHLAGLVREQETNHSFAIGITGKWGSGKSVFMDQIAESLQNCIQIKFNPWLSKNTEHIVEDFFKVVIDKVKPYDKSLSAQIDRYSSTLLNLEEALKFKISNFFGLGQQYNYKSLEDQRMEIRKNIIRHRIKMVVFIDDLDRLNSEEALAVLSIIRNSFDFPNMFFFVAYDFDYLQELLDAKKIKNPSSFLDKIFQLDIDLPAFPTHVLKSQLVSLLTTNKTKEQSEDIISSIEEIENNIQLRYFVSNLRDCVRLTNSFNHIFEKKFAQVNTTDFLLLELLKLKDKNQHNQIRERLFTSSHNSYIHHPSHQANEAPYIRFEEPTFKNTPNTNTDLIPILAFLFNRTVSNNSNSLKSISTPGNAIRYFSDHLFDAISFAAFDVYKQENGWENFRAFIEISLATDKVLELREVFLRVGLPYTKVAFTNLLKGICYYSNRTALYDLIDDLAPELHSHKYLTEIQNTFDEKKIYEEILEPTGQLYRSQAMLGKLLIEKNKEFPARKDVVEKSLLIGFEHILTNALVFEREHVSTYGIIIKNEPSESSLFKEATQKTSTYVRKYIDQFLCSGLIRRIGDKYFITHLVEKLIGWNDFEQILYAQPESLEVLSMLEFYKKYKKNDYRPEIHNFNSVSLVSDRRTKFHKSLTYPNLAKSDSVETTRDEKYKHSGKFSVLHSASWISKDHKVTLEEAVNGGIYDFFRFFNLDLLKHNLQSAVLYFLVDDYLSLKVNGVALAGKFQGFDKVIHRIDITAFLRSNNNLLRFTIENAILEESEAKKFEDPNPYEFIYNLVLIFENPVIIFEDQSYVSEFEDNFDID